MPVAARAVLTVPVWCNRNAQGLGPQVRHLAEEIHRRFRVAVFELPIGRTHTTHRLDLTMGTLGQPGDLLLPHLQQEVFPPLQEVSLAQIIFVNL